MSVAPKIACPACGSYESKVKNTRPLARVDGVYRRRECLNPKCLFRFSTCETVVTHQKNSSHHNI